MRWRQRLRTSYLFAHFYKWRLGDGERCLWCSLVRDRPRLQRIIPYSWDPVE